MLYEVWLWNNVRALLIGVRERRHLFIWEQGWSPYRCAQSTGLDVMRQSHVSLLCCPLRQTHSPAPGMPTWGGGWCLQLICVPPNFLSSLCYFSPLKRSQRKKKKKTQQVSWPLTAGGDAREQPVPLHVMDGSTETACLICSRARAGSMPSNASAALFPLIKTCHFCTWE